MITRPLTEKYLNDDIRGNYTHHGIAPARERAQQHSCPRVHDACSSNALPRIDPLAIYCSAQPLYLCPAAMSIGTLQLVPGDLVAPGVPQAHGALANLELRRLRLVPGVLGSRDVHHGHHVRLFHLYHL